MSIKKTTSCAPTDLSFCRSYSQVKRLHCHTRSRRTSGFLQHSETKRPTYLKEIMVIDQDIHQAVHQDRHWFSGCYLLQCCTLSSRIEAMRPVLRAHLQNHSTHHHPPDRLFYTHPEDLGKQTQLHYQPQTRKQYFLMKVAVR